MLILAILFFAFAAILGLYLLSYVLQNKNTPKAVAFTHGPLGTVGLLILIMYAFLYQPAPIISIVLFAFAIVGGLLLIYRDITGKSIPKWLAIGHGLTAVVAFLYLVYFAFAL